MISTNWREGIEKVLDPDSAEILRFNLTDWLAGDTLDPGTTLVDVVGATAQVLQVSTAAGFIDFRLTGMAEGATTSVTVRALSAPSGRQDDFTLKIVVRNK